MIVDNYANQLCRLVSEALSSEPGRYKGCKTFQDLHDVCDANEFLIEVDELLGIENDPEDEAYCATVNSACDAVDAMLGQGVAA